MYLSLTELVLKNADQILPASHENPRDAAAYIMAVMRVLLVLHHDFQDFLYENHARLCVAAPAKCSQIRNLINSAFPSSSIDQPDPYTTGLKTDRMEEMRVSPTIRLEPAEDLENAGLKTTVDELLAGKSGLSSDVATLLGQYDDDGAFLQALVLYMANDAISAAGPKSQMFSKTSPHYAVLEGLASGSSVQATNHLINAMVNQLRYPNAHTNWFYHALLELFRGSTASAADHLQLQEIIATVLFQRLMPQRPHPWGLLVTFMELIKNGDYDFQSLPFVREHEELWTRPRALEPLSAPGIPPPGISGF